jgi:hypothetical protein
MGQGLVFSIWQWQRARHDVKQTHSPFAEEPHTLSGKIVFAAIWTRVAVVSWWMNRNLVISGARRTYFSTKIIWKKGMRRLIKRALVPIPPVRRYLAEKHILQSSLMQSSAECIRLRGDVEQMRLAQEAIFTERDALTVECIHLRAEVEQRRSGLKAIATERDAQAVERAHLQNEVELSKAVTTERDALRIERIHLQAEIERQRIALAALAAERDSLFSGQQGICDK